MSLKQKLLISFIFLSGIIFTLGVSTRFAFIESEQAMDRVLYNSTLLIVLNAASTNLAVAGKIPFELEQTVEGTDELEDRVMTLKAEFKSLSQEIQTLVQGEKEKEQTDNFIIAGKLFYEALDEFFPIKLSMMAHYSFYLGEIHSLPVVLLQREFAHIKFIQELNENVNTGSRVSEGLDYRNCGFYQWVESNTFDDETVNEVLQEMTPLHINLHNTAAEIDKLIATGDHEGARGLLSSIHKGLRQLGRLFGGLTRYSQNSFQLARDQYEVQQKKIQKLYIKSSDSAAGLTDLLEESMLQSAKQDLKITTQNGKKFIYFTSALGVLLCLIIGYYSARKAEGAIRDKESANNALSISLEDQKLTNQQLGQEIVKRKEIEKNLQNANEILTKVAVTDGLTGLFNHRHMKKALEYEWHRAKRFKQELAVLMLDIDFFKRVNDTYGHGCGDTILQEVAEIFRKRIRYTDTLGLSYDKQDTMLARYGGEEMVAILPDTSIFGATAVAEELRQKIENTTFICGENEIKITISIGVSVNSGQNDTDWQDILERADAALYHAKESGRNRVIGDIGSDLG
jgi:diguanylate cyclase (GGDEF)-like protein